MDRTWDGEGEQILEATFSAEILIQGENQILLHVDGDTSATAEVNWFNVTNNDGDIFLAGEAQRQVSSDSREVQMCFIPLCYLEIQHW